MTTVYKLGQRVCIRDYSYALAFDGTTPLGHDWLRTTFGAHTSPRGVILGVEDNQHFTQVPVAIRMDGHPDIMVITRTDLIKPANCAACGRPF